jgi:hypothetical protein
VFTPGFWGVRVAHNVSFLHGSHQKPGVNTTQQRKLTIWAARIPPKTWGKHNATEKTNNIVSFLCCVVFTPGFWWDPCCPSC